MEEEEEEKKKRETKIKRCESGGPVRESLLPVNFRLWRSVSQLIFQIPHTQPPPQRLSNISQRQDRNGTSGFFFSSLFGRESFLSLKEKVEWGETTHSTLLNLRVRETQVSPVS